MNNETTAKLPLQPVAENSEVLRQVIDGEIVRNGHGPFEPTPPPSTESK